MASKPQTHPQTVSFTFPAVSSKELGSLAHPSANNSHCSGVNALAVDSERSILYSAGRDSSIRAWSFGNHESLVNAKLRPGGLTLPVRCLLNSYLHSSLALMTGLVPLILHNPSRCLLSADPFSSKLNCPL